MADIGIQVIIALISAVVVMIFVVVLGATVLVAVAVRQEKRLRSFGEQAPTPVARMARSLLGIYLPRQAEQIFPRPERELPAWYERSSGMR